MRIRQVWIQHFRNFKGDRGPISFVDEATGQVRPVTMFVGSNGSGKTTIFEVIEGLLGLPLGMGDGAFTLPGRIATMQNGGFGAIEVEFGPDTAEPFRTALGPILNQGLIIAFGDSDAGSSERSHTPVLTSALRRQTGWTATNPPLADALRQMVARCKAGQEPMAGGLLHFPHDRWIRHNHRGGIEPPPEARDWIFRFRPSDAWAGSLAQLWVWENYLDLEEQQQAGRKNLAPFVEVIEELLGHGQRVQIRQGRVTIQRPHLGDEAGLDELPSGEQQILTLFGELARRIRPGAVVLLDEAEISLHPALQRAVLHHLRQLGRKYDLQIILTTHSMELVRAAGPGEVINLDNMALEERARTEH